MKFFEKKTEKPVRDDVIDEAYIDRLLSGDRKPAKPAKKPLPIRKPLILFGGVGLVLVFALITMIVAVSVGRRTDRPPPLRPSPPPRCRPRCPHRLPLRCRPRCPHRLPLRCRQCGPRSRRRQSLRKNCFIS